MLPPKFIGSVNTPLFFSTVAYLESKDEIVIFRPEIDQKRFLIYNVATGKLVQEIKLEASFPMRNWAYILGIPKSDSFFCLLGGDQTFEEVGIFDRSGKVITKARKKTSSFHSMTCDSRFLVSAFYRNKETISLEAYDGRVVHQWQLNKTLYTKKPNYPTKVLLYTMA